MAGDRVGQGEDLGFYLLSSRWPWKGFRERRGLMWCPSTGGEVLPWSRPNMVEPQPQKVEVRKERGEQGWAVGVRLKFWVWELREESKGIPGGFWKKGR